MHTMQGFHCESSEKFQVLGLPPIQHEHPVIGVMAQLIVKRFFLGKKYITLEILLNARVNSQETFVEKKSKMELPVLSVGVHL